MVRLPGLPSLGLKSPLQTRSPGGQTHTAAIGGRGPTPAFARALSSALLARQDQSRSGSGHRQDFPRAHVLGAVADANLSRLISRTALSRTGPRGRMQSASPRTGAQPARADVDQYFPPGAASRPHPSAFDGHIREASQRHQVPEELIKAVIKVESNFNPRATSPKGAMGLMQLMPGTARDLGVSQGYDPRQNIDGGTRYLRFLLDRYQGSVPKALAAYNWGPGNLDRGRSLPQETRSYLQLISRYTSIRQVPPKNAAKPLPQPAPRPSASATTKT